VLVKIIECMMDVFQSIIISYRKEEEKGNGKEKEKHTWLT
jgi:hypothetical protein